MLVSCKRAFTNDVIFCVDFFYPPPLSFFVSIKKLYFFTPPQKMTSFVNAP